MKSFEDELIQLNAGAKKYEEMSDIVDGPFNPPSEEEIELGIFEQEYFRARSCLLSELEKSTSMSSIWVMDYAEGSRCLGIRILDDSKASLLKVTTAARNALARIKNEMGVEYCVGVGFCDMAREDLPEWLVGVTIDQICYTTIP